MTFEMSSEEFFLQLGPDYKKYVQTFNENGFTDVETICIMKLPEDLDTMFTGNDLKLALGHRRKIENAIQNLKIAITKKDDVSQDRADSGLTEETGGSMIKLQKKQSSKLAALDEKLQKALSSQTKMDYFIPLPEPQGPFKNQTCSICHIRGHRSDGNKNMSHCDRDPCTTWKFCGRKDKHKAEVNREKREAEKVIKEINKEIAEVKAEKEKTDSFAQKSQTSFMFVMKPRLKAIDHAKYSLNVNLLMRDLLILKDYYDTKLPKHDSNDDQIELRKALCSMNSLKRKSHFTASEDDDERKSDPVKVKCPKTSTITNAQQSAVDTQAQQTYMYPYTNPYYNYGYPMYVNPYYQYQQQPPLPMTPPPVNPPLPKGPPPQ